ncbi:hypothetical protein L1987_43170 [Smallanthus sonchifolius]|uniref:Uncharacterized protein n=1 Tax=Smallanthus sonchifolius TaxID=185202 RepID=A0ACB9GLM4_9ASTR|nr:hypothetical protein L1987_43170 [Smallanthus sonchifolius]
MFRRLATSIQSISSPNDLNPSATPLFLPQRSICVTETYHAGCYALVFCAYLHHPGSRVATSISLCFVDDNMHSGSRGAHLNLKRAEKARMFVPIYLPKT